MTSSGISVAAPLGCPPQLGCSQSTELGTGRDGDLGDILSRGATNDGGVPGILSARSPGALGILLVLCVLGSTRGHGWGGDTSGRGAWGHR